MKWLMVFKEIIAVYSQNYPNPSTESEVFSLLKQTEQKVLIQMVGGGGGLNLFSLSTSWSDLIFLKSDNNGRFYFLLQD
jgi:hypothetical protein